MRARTVSVLMLSAVFLLGTAIGIGQMILFDLFV
jgi:hypothetical protein